MRELILKLAVSKTFMFMQPCVWNTNMTIDNRVSEPCLALQCPQVFRAHMFWPDASGPPAKDTSMHQQAVIDIHLNHSKADKKM